MIDLSLRKKILLSFLNLIIVSSITTITAVLLATNNSVKDQAQEKLSVGLKVFEQLLDIRVNQLFDSAEVLTSDFGFKSAVLDNDELTINSVLSNHGARIGADLMMLASLDGGLIASTGAQQQEGQFPFQYLLSEAQENGGVMRTVMFSGHPYQILMLPIKAPITKAWAVMGFKMDGKLADQLKELTTLEVTLVGEDSMQRRFELTTLAEEKWTNKTLLDRQGEWLFMTHDQEEYLALETELAKGQEYYVEAVLSTSIDKALAKFSPLKIQVLFISGIALVLSAMIAFVIARNISRPVNTLVYAAERISSGDYSADIGFDGYKNNEIGKLAKSIGQMQEGIADREDKILHQVYHDPLTGLSNRAAARERMITVINASKSKAVNKDGVYEYPDDDVFALLQLNVKRFKLVNNTFGYKIGDQLLIAISERLTSLLNPDDLAARLGADEFMVILHARSQDEVIARAKSVLDQVSLAYRLNDLNVPVYFAAGMSVFPNHGDRIGQLMRRADIALNESHDDNIDLVVYTAGTEERHLKQNKLIADLKEALQKASNQDNGLAMFYQPKVDIKKQCVTQVEALIRWVHPDFGFVRPDEFIGLAEQSGLMPDLSRWVIQRVLRDAADWKARNIELQMAINLSAYDLATDELPDYVSTLLAQYSLNSSCLILEVTESAMIEKPAQALRVLNRFKELGIGLAIDDYGTGYSSLSQLKDLPVDELKIDMSFVLKLDQNNYDQAIVNSTIKMGHELGLTVVAEGVENRESWRLLEEWGCDKLQGYYIAKPQNAEEFVAWYQTYDVADEYVIDK